MTTSVFKKSHNLLSSLRFSLIILLLFRSNLKLVSSDQSWLLSFPPLSLRLGVYSCDLGNDRHHLDQLVLTAAHSKLLPSPISVRDSFRMYVPTLCDLLPFDRTQLTSRQVHHVLDRILSRVPLVTDWNTQQNLRTCARWAQFSLDLPLSHSQNYEYTSATDNLQNYQLRSLTYLLRREFLHRGSCRVLHAVA